MSIKVSDLVWGGGYTGNGGSDMLVLLALADWSNDAGGCWPSMQSIAMRTKLSRSQAQRVVHRLMDGGWLKVTGNAFGGAPGATCRFQLAIDRLRTGSASATPTGSTDATGSVDATGRTHAADGSQGCGETGSAGATQTVIEPSVTVKRAGKRTAHVVPATSKALKPSRPKREAITFSTYIAQCQVAGVKPIPDDHPVRRYAADVHLEPEMLEIAWLTFKDRHLTDPNRRDKRQKDWPATFASSIKGRWYGLWVFGQGGLPVWSSNGMQARAAAQSQLNRQVAQFSEAEAAHG